MRPTLTDLRVGLIGYGLAGEFFHAPLIEATGGLALTSIASSQGTRVQRRWPHATIFDSPEAFFDRADVDIVVIATPNHLHYGHGHRALEHGWHVVMDKPMTVTSAEADSLIALAASKGLMLTPFQNRRWDGDFRTARRLIEGGALGEVHLFESRFDRYRPAVQDRWRERDLPGAGLLYDLGPHLIDQALLLFGTPAWVHARIEKQREGAIRDDFFHLMLGYPRTTALLSAGSLVRAPGPRFRIEGYAGTYVKHGTDPQEAALRAGGSPAAPGFGEDAPSDYGHLVADPGGVPFDGPLRTDAGRYVEFYESLASAVRHGSAAPVDARDARTTLRVIEAALGSHDAGRRIAVSDG